MSAGWLRRGKAAIRNPHFWVVLVLLSLSLLLMLPRGVFISPSSADVLLEAALIILVGIFAVLWLKARAKRLEVVEEQEQAAAAVLTVQGKLRSQIRSTMKYQRQLAALGNLSSLLTQSQELEPLLRSFIAAIMEVAGVEVVLIFGLEEEPGELLVMAYEGVPQGFAQAVDRIKLGEGFNGRVAETGEPLLVQDASQDTRLTRDAVRQENLRAQLIVPMKSRDRVVGTLTAAMRRPREFTADEMALLAAIGNELGVAIENARLYQQQRAVMEQLRRSEKHYRQLFESAHDAIWIHDLEGNILSANKATETLMGYSMGELRHMNVKDFLSPEALERAREARQRLLQGEAMPQPYEQCVTRRNGAQATLMLTTNLICSDGQPRAFENIARDITEEKRMQENLRFYVQQVTRAQEEERLRIAQELHDSTAQSLIALLHQLENLLHHKANLPVGEARELWAFHEQIKDILQEVRYLSRNLRPSILDDVGLLAALHWAVRELKTEYGVEASLEIHGAERRFPREAELLLFRIAQEALRNIGRHSHASKAEVSIKFEDGKTAVAIRDNGIGFQLPDEIGDLSRSGKLGLLGMQERAQLLGGNLEIRSEPGKGTTVTFIVPYEPRGGERIGE